MILLGGLLIILLAYVIFLFLEIRHIDEQMTYILNHDTNAEITITTKNKFIKAHLNKCNQLLRQNKQIKQQQQKSELELHQILMSLTHDLKTPLTVAAGYTQLLLQNEPHHELVKKIYTSLHSVNYYLNCLTDYNLIQEKSITTTNEDIDFSQFLMEQLFQYYEEFERKHIQVHIEIPSNILINNDKIILKRIIDNIVSNVLKYADTQVSIVVTNIDHTVEFVCENDYLGKINDPSLLLLRFQTLDDSRRNKSMGIGLPIIQELINLINGAFTIAVTANTFTTKITLKSA